MRLIKASSVTLTRLVSVMLNKIQYNTTALSIIIFYWNNIHHITRILIWFYETENESGLFVPFCGEQNKHTRCLE